MNPHTLYGFTDELQKIAASTDDQEYVIVPKSWWKGIKAQSKATMHRGREHPELIARREEAGSSPWNGLKGFGIGAGIGTGVGSLTGLAVGSKKPQIGPTQGALAGAALGAAIGARIGAEVGDLKTLRADINTEKEWLLERGVKPTWGGLGRGKFTAEAAKKYLR